MEEDDLGLFETRRCAVKGRIVYRVFATSVFIAILFVWFYRASNLLLLIGIGIGGVSNSSQSLVNVGRRRWALAWFGMFCSELWFGFYWILTQSHRWNAVYRHTFKDRLSKRYPPDKEEEEEDKQLPKVDIFVCTADPDIEPPMLVINTVLSLLAYDYPPHKLSVYLSDDAASHLTFHALVLASHFAKHWLPFCNKFNIEPRSPTAYFASKPLLSHDDTSEFHQIKKLFRELENEVEKVAKKEQKPEFPYWNSYSSRKDHDTILQMVIDGNDEEARDIIGNKLPTLVYLAREKRPQHFHNFKAGAMNALLRVSSGISNAPIILNVDCDMYSNNSQSIQDALCFFMDEQNGHQFSYVQFPQCFHNMTKNDLYASSLRVDYQVAFPGMDAYGGPLYIGTGCFHRRDVLCGRKYNKEDRIGLGGEVVFKKGEMEALINLASCKYEENTEWGSKVGLRYGCSVEDVITGLSIQSEGWKSVYYNPERKGFLGVAGTTVDEVLVQQKRWSEGQLQIILSKYSPLWYGIGKIHFGLVMGYCTYNLWAVNCFATLYYSVIPSLYLLKGISLFPDVSNPWFVPFAYVIVAANMYSFGEFLWAGGTVLGWWNDQRMWLYKRTTSYVFAILDTVLKRLGIGYGNSTFVVSSKVSVEDVSRRYKNEVMEFGTTSPMAYILSSLAMLNLICLIGAVLLLVGGSSLDLGRFFLQILLCGVLVLINLPLYDALFFRKDMGKIPRSVAVKSFVVSLSVCFCFVLDIGRSPLTKTNRC